MIPTVYPTTADLKKAGQRIVYLLNPHVGHLDIFVSASVAKLEHRAMLESLGDPDCRKSQYTVRFEDRQSNRFTMRTQSNRLKRCRPCLSGTNC